MGVVRSPPRAAPRSRAGNPSAGATPQNTAAELIVSASIVGGPRRSTSLPINGAPTPIPTVAAATVSPAAA